MSLKNTIKRKAKKEVKKVVKKNKGFVLALAISLALGIALGTVGINYLQKSDEFTLYNNGVAMETATVNLASGSTYDVTATENQTKVVAWGKDVSSYITYEIKYINEEEEKVETVTEFTKDGTYCIIYSLDYTGDDFITKIAVKKYEKAHIRKTIIVGGNE